MGKEFMLGILLGASLGAIVVTNSKKVRKCILEKQNKMFSGCVLQANDED